MNGFPDRHAAGAALGQQLFHLDLNGALVLGLPRGGVPVAFEVATRLGAALDVFVVRKLGVPGHEELAMGAIATGGVRVLMPEVIAAMQVEPADIDAVIARERAELERRERAYRGTRPFPALAGRTVVLVDDGVATGASMLAAVRAVRALGARRIIAAAPVMSPSAVAAIGREADGCEAIVVPAGFEGVGQYYRDFSQTTDEEVQALLEIAQKARPMVVGRRAL